jgi:hypothetical protein
MIINGKELNVENITITFNTLCKLEEMGVDMSNNARPMTMIRAFIALYLHETVDQAGKDIEQYVIDGGDLQALVTPISDAFEKSGFFQALSKQKPELVVEEKHEPEQISKSKKQ